MSAPITAQPAKHFISAGAHRLCYVEGGAKHLPKAVFLHGWIASHQLYRKVWNELGELFHFYALDLPGFGDSDKPSPAECAYDPPFYAEALRAFVDAVGITEPYTLVAQSMGGMVATEKAVRFPDRIERLILIDSAGIEMPPPILGRILQAPVIGKPLFMTLGGTRKAISDFLRNDVYFVKSVFDEAVVDDILRAQRMPGGREAAYAAMMRMVSAQACRLFTPRLAEVKVPTRLIWGEQDKLFPLERCGREMEARIRGARLIVVPGSGHEPPVETPAAFVAALREALADGADAAGTSPSSMEARVVAKRDAESTTTAPRR